jgi:hypothetical protein
MRTCPLSEIEKAIDVFDFHSQSAIEQFLAKPLTDAMRDQIRLAQDSGGLGLTKSKEHFLAAHLGSLVAVRDTVKLILGVGENDPLPYIDSLRDKAIVELNQRVKPADAIPLPITKDIAKKLTQANLSKRIGSRQLQLLQGRFANDNLQLARLSAVSQKQSGAFLTATLGYGNGPSMDDQHFMVALLHRIGFQFVDENHICPHDHKSTQHAGLLNSHFQNCKFKGNLIRRHDALKFQLAATARKVGIRVELEPLMLIPDAAHQHQRPADIFLQQYFEGRNVAVDVTFVNPLLPDVLTGTIKNAKFAANDRERKKSEKYRANLDTHGIGFRPFAMTTYGGFGDHALTFIHELATVISRNEDTQIGTEMKRIYEHLSIVAHNSFADAIIDRIGLRFQQV